MFWKMSWVTLKRNKVRTFLLGILIALIVIFTILGCSMYDNCNYLLDQANKSYTTIGVLEYTAGKYPDDTMMTKEAEKRIKDFPIETILEQPQVEGFQEPYLMLGYSNGVQVKNSLGSPYFNNVIIKFRVMYDSGNGNFLCVLLDPYYSKEAKIGTTFNLSRAAISEKGAYGLQKDHFYIANGDFRKESNLMVFSPSENAGINEKDKSAIKISGFPIVDITDQPDYLTQNPEGKEWEKLRDYYDIQNNSLRVLAVESPKKLQDFFLGSSSVTQGRMWDESENKTGEKVCMIHAAIAARLELKVGDSIDLNLHYSEDSLNFFDSYQPKTGFKDSVSYKIVGVFEKFDEDGIPTVIVPQNTIKQLPVNQVRYNMGTITLKNGTAKEFKKAVSKSTVNHFSISVFDEGYEQTVFPILAMRMNSIIIIALSLSCAVVILILFGILFVVKQKETISIMTALGTGNKNIRKYVMSGSLMIGGIASVIGGIVAFFATKSVVSVAYHLVKKVHVKDLRYSILAMGKQHIFQGKIRSSLVLAAIISLVVLIILLLICLYYTNKVIRETANFGGQTRKKKRKKAEIKSKHAKKEAHFEDRKVELTSKSYSKRRKISFVFFTSRRSLFLNRKVNSILIATSVCISIFIIGYSSSINQYKEMMETAYDKIEVNGSFRTVSGKKIPASYIPLSTQEYMQDAINVQGIYRTMQNKYEYLGFVKNETTPVAEAELNATNLIKMGEEKMQFPTTGFGKEIRMSEIGNDQNLCVTDNMERSEEFFQELPPKINYLKGYENIFEKPMEDDWKPAFDKYKVPTVPVIVTSNFLTKQNLVLGDIITVSHIVLIPDEGTYVYHFINCKIVGNYISNTDEDTIYMSMLEEGTKLIHPDVQRFLKINEINYKLGNTKSIHILKDKLEKEDVFPVGIWSASRVSFVIDDAELIQTIDGYQNGISFMENLRYLLFLLIFMIGFVSTYLSMRSRIQEMAIMRSLGTGSVRVFIMFLLEQMVLAAFGMLLGTGIASLYLGNVRANELIMVGIFFIFFMGGSIISIVKMNKNNVLEILTTAE